MMSELPEFAEEYNLRERVRLLVVGLAFACAFVLPWKLWLLPAYTSFVASADCLSVFGIAGSAVLWYGLFVGLPLIVALVVACMEGRYGLKILRDGQCPPVGVKVLRRTRIKRGAAARRAGYLNLFAFTPLLAIAVWGFFQAEWLSKMSPLKHPACTANNSLKRAAASGYGKLQLFVAAAASLKR
jgi:hypothetical protein